MAMTSKQQSTIRQRETNISIKKSSDGGSSGGQSLRMALASLGGGGGSISGAIREVATDPQGVIQHRQREKRDLQDLNDRFATYIERIRFYEVENKRLKLENEGLRTSLIQLEKKMKELYENELANARMVIDQTTKSKAAVELKVAGLEADLKEYRSKYELELKAHTVTKDSLPKLEKALSDRDATIEYMTKTLKAMELELGKFKSESASLRRELSELRTNCDGEIVSRIELESQLQSRDDEIQFLTNMYEEKIRILMETDAGEYQEFFSNELAMAIRDIRAEYEAIAESYRGADTEGWYKAKFNEMMSASQRAGSDLIAVKEELKASRAKWNESQKELTRLRAENSSLRERAASMEGEMAMLEKQFATEKAELEAELNALRAQLATQILELKELMDSKLLLDAEIATYRRLLQGEESRVKEISKTIVDQSGGGGGGFSSGGGGQQISGGGGFSSSSSSSGGGGGGFSSGGGGFSSSSSSSGGGVQISGGGSGGQISGGQISGGIHGGLQQQQPNITVKK